MILEMFAILLECPPNCVACDDDFFCTECEEGYGTVSECQGINLLTFCVVKYVVCHSCRVSCSNTIE